jgi:DNA polymerase III epsilon subunit-like protein
MKRVFLDLESTGLDPRYHHIWEFAAILRDEWGSPDEEHVWQLRPSLVDADPVALEKGRFEERFVVPDGVDAVKVVPEDDPWPGLWRMERHEALSDIQDLLRDAHIIGANTAFDDSFLKALMHMHQRRIVWNYRLVCVENLVAGALKKPLPMSLSESAEAMGVKVDPDTRHTALGDARLARDVYDAVMGGGGRG